MKLCRIIALTGALLASTIPSAFAASAVKAEIPFAFIVGNRTMPAGEYTVVSSTGGSTVLYIHGMGSGVAVISSPSGISSADAKNPGLIFQTRGSQRYLVGVQMSDEPGRSIPEPAFRQTTLTAVR